MFDWLYGKRMPSGNAAGTTLRNLTLDVDTLLDVKGEFVGLVERFGGMASLFPPGAKIVYDVTEQYALPNRAVTAAEVRALGVPDRNQLFLSVEIAAWVQEDETLETQTATLTLDCRSAMIDASGQGVGHARWIILEQIADFLYRHGDARPDWVGAGWLRALFPLPFALLAWLWIAITVEIPLPVNLLILAVLAMALIPVYDRARKEMAAEVEVYGRRSIRFRGESRSETYERRASRHENLKVAAVTLPAGAILGVLGTLFTRSIVGG